MNILAHLQFGDNVSALYHKDYLVVGCHTHLMRGYNAYHPNTTPTCESFEVTVVAPGKEDLELHEWFFKNSSRSGRLLFELMDVRTDQEGEMKRAFYFDSAQCFSLREHYDLKERSQRLLTLRISAKTFRVDHVLFGEDPDSFF